LRLIPLRLLGTERLPTISASLLVEWVALVSLFGFAAMGVDKLLAVGKQSRVSERTLWVAALLGGFPGIFFGGLVFHHKTSKTEFWGPVVVSAVLWAAAWQLLSKPI
jgi:uncharacterized membrane protein YsdA (DUF1294 family)